MAVINNYSESISIRNIKTCITYATEGYNSIIITIFLNTFKEFNSPLLLSIFLNSYYYYVIYNYIQL